jgi:hypothetical protein
MTKKMMLGTNRQMMNFPINAAKVTPVMNPTLAPVTNPVTTVMAV